MQSSAPAAAPRPQRPRPQRRTCRSQRQYVGTGLGGTVRVHIHAEAMRGDREECLAAGMDDCVTKPIRVDALVQALLGVTPSVGCER